MYTGYFGKYTQYIMQHLTPVSISSRSPDWYYSYEYKNLAPSPRLIGKYKRKEISAEEYTLIFNEYLSSLSPEKILAELKSRFSDDLDRIVLMCYERPEKFCHRQLVADWINKNTDCKVEEFYEDQIGVYL